MVRYLGLGLLSLLLSLRSFVSLAADWPQFRGADRSGVSQEANIPWQWDSTKNLLWKVELPGPGSSSPIVFGERVYVTCYTGYGEDVKVPGELADLRRHLLCIDRLTGKILWSRAATDPAISDAPYKDGNIALHGYASHTPAADETGVYAYFGAAGAFGYSHAGEPKWHAAIGSKAKNNSYGSGASPVLYGGRLIINGSIETANLYEQGETVALDASTGREIWREKAGGEWSSPCLAFANGKPELVLATRRGPWLGLDLASGKRLWECAAKEYCGTPVVRDGIIYALGGDSRAAMRAGGRGDVTDTHKLWDTAGGTWISSPAYYQGRLYWSAQDGGLVYCADARTGDLIYRERLPKCGRIFASPVVADGRIYYVSREHGTYVLAAEAEYKLLAHNQLDDASVFNGSPAVSNGHLFLRSDRYLYCLIAR